jgi:hypothetical protein
MSADNTAREQVGRPFTPGQSGNPAGRPKGSKNKLAEAFIAELCEDWSEHGATVIARVREQSPETYLKVVASVVPKELKVQRSPFEDWSDEELTGAITALDRSIQEARDAER